MTSALRTGCIECVLQTVCYVLASAVFKLPTVAQLDCLRLATMPASYTVYAVEIVRCRSYSVYSVYGIYDHRITMYINVYHTVQIIP